jgi:hypothetical protein
MSRKWIVPLIVAVAAGIVTYGVTWMASRERNALTPDRLKDVSFLTRELNLNAEQANEIKSLHATLGAALTECCATHCAARTRLGRALVTEAAGSEETESIVTAMARAYEESEWATVNHIRAVRALLDARQRSLFDAMVTNSMCASCSMPGGTVAPEPEQHE